MPKTQEMIAGVDEVGRGCLFGPVVAAAAVIPESLCDHLQTLGITDSKQLSSTRRAALYEQIKGLVPIRAVGLASVTEIDRLNILQASLLAMRRAITRLDPAPDLCLVDGNQKIPQLALPQQTVIKGDQKELAIATASIIAKVWRDQLITRLALKYPGYDLAANKGYGTRRHRQGLAKLGPTRLHRLSFAPCRMGEKPKLHTL
ncbi:MAG: ribonuclease HII [Cyanobacteria bacterium P01_A01_bin.17]